MLAFLQVCGVTAAREPAYGERLERQKQQFLCEWRAGHVDMAYMRLAVCDDTVLPIATARVKVRDWWVRIFEHYPPEVADALFDHFDADWRASSLKASSLQGDNFGDFQKEANYAIEAAETDKKNILMARERARHAAINAKAGEMTDDQLCAALHDDGYPSLRDELRRRDVLSQSEWSLVNQHQLAIGMSETALLCSLGRTSVNRTIVGDHTRKQYVYRQRLYVYVEDGKVTGIQDHQEP